MAADRVGHCPRSGKRSYPSRQLAKQLTRKAGNRLRVYFCDSCKQWHVTRQSVREHNRGWDG